MFILNNLLIELIDLHFLLAMRRAQHIHKVLRKLLAIVFDVFLRILPDQQYLSDVAFALDVAAPPLAHYPHHFHLRIFEEEGGRDSPFKPILIAHLLLACLAVPAQSA